MPNEKNTVAPAKGGENRIKAVLSASFKDYQRKATEAAATVGSVDAVLENRYEAAAAYQVYLTGASEMASAFGASDEETKTLATVKRAVDLDIDRLNNEADLQDVLG